MTDSNLPEVRTDEDLSRFLSDKVIYRDESHLKEVGYTDNADKKLELGDQVYVLTWSPPISSFADVQYVNEYSRREFYSELSEAKQAFSDHMSPNWSGNDVVLVKAQLTGSHEGGTKPVKLKNIEMVHRSLPEI